jgi:hypothetical protein
MTDIFLALGELLLFIMILFLFHERQIRRWTVKMRKFYNDFKKGNKMSIQWEYELEVLSCDICGVNFDFESWDEAVEYKKENGWVSRKEDGGWIDICPDCQE